MSIKLNLKGFNELLENIQKANGNVLTATEKALKGSADIMQSTLKAEMAKSNVPSDLISAMPPYTTETNANRVTARVGYRKGNYDPKNPSDGYKVVFLNYGTPNRTIHGKVTARGFIERAKRKAKPKMKKQQEQTLKEILRGLE